MNYSEVKELLQAGFTAEEIRTMMNPQENNPQNPQGNSQSDKTPDDAKFNQLNETMTKILNAIQSSNRQNNSFDSINKTDLNSEVDKIMGSIIRPERKEGGSN